MDLKIVPSVCEASKDEAGADVPASFSGSVTIRLPTMPESYRMKAKYGRKSIGMAKGDDVETRLGSMELIAEIAEDIKDNFVKVAIEDLKSGKKINSVEDLYSYEPAFVIIAEVAGKFIQGFAEKN
jgi:hypothetical protein